MKILITGHMGFVGKYFMKKIFLALILNGVMIAEISLR
jgi:dTDP-D-glucose 4,6-dehydratase